MDLWGPVLSHLFQPFAKMAAKILGVALVQQTTHIFASSSHKRVIFVTKHMF